MLSPVHRLPTPFLALLRLPAVPGCPRVWEPHGLIIAGSGTSEQAPTSNISNCAPPNPLHSLHPPPTGSGVSVLPYSPVANAGEGNVGEVQSKFHIPQNPVAEWTRAYSLSIYLYYPGPFLQGLEIFFLTSSKAGICQIYLATHLLHFLHIKIFFPDLLCKYLISIIGCVKTLMLEIWILCLLRGH